MKFTRIALKSIGVLVAGLTVFTSMYMVSYMHSSYCWYIKAVFRICDSRMFLPITINLVFIGAGFLILRVIFFKAKREIWTLIATAAYGLIAHAFNYLLLSSIPVPLR